MPAKPQIASPLGLAMNRTLAVILLSAVLYPTVSSADYEFHWNGFATLAAGTLDDDEINQTNAIPHNVYDEDVQYDVDTRVGLQGTVLSDYGLSGTVQLASVGSENYDVDVEWAYLGYQVNDQFTLRAGHMRRPLYAFSDYLYVGYAYTWIRPPLEVYSRDLRFYDGIDAIDLYYQVAWGQWDFGLQAYYGNSSGSAEVQFGNEVDYKTRDDAGIVLEWESNELNFRFGYHYVPNSSVETTSEQESLISSLEMAGFTTIVDNMRIENTQVNFYNFAAGLDRDNWLAQFEFISVPLDDNIAPDESSWYAMGGWRVGASTFHLTYAERQRKQTRNFSAPISAQAAQIAPFDATAAAALNQLAAGVDFAATQSDIEQHSYTLGVRYDLNYSAAVKVGFQRIFDDRNHLRSDLFSVAVDILF